MALRFPSAGQRFVRTLIFSLLQAAIFGSGVGLLVYFRPTPSQWMAGAEESAPLGAWFPRTLEGYESKTFDWRVRELARHTTASSNVVWVPVDAETLAFIRGEPRGEVARRPWSRALLGKLRQQLGSEGASVALLDVPLADASPREEGDDVALGQVLDTPSLKTVIGFDVSESLPASTGERLHPFLLWIGTHARRADARANLVRVLSARRTVFLIPNRNSFEVWAGVEDENDAHALSRMLQLRGTMRFREFSAAERNDQVHAVDLLVEQSQIRVEGLNPSRLLQIRTLEPPVAPLLGGHASLGALTLPRSPDGVVRGLPLVVNYARDEGDVNLLPSAVLATAMELAGTQQLRFEKGRLWVGDRYSIPMDASGFSYLRWEGSGAPTASAWRLVVNLLDTLAGAPPHYPLELSTRAVVFSDGPGTMTSVDIPLDANTSPGALLAQALGNLVSSRGIARASLRWDVTATFTLAFAAAFLAFTLRGTLRSGPGALFYVLVLGVSGVGYVFYARDLFLSQGRWVAVAGPLLALVLSGVSTTLYAIRTDLEVSDFIAHVLGRYVSPDVARQVFRNVALMRPERRTVTVMFSDLEGFGRLNERLSPEQISELLHEWLTEVTAAVHERGGQVEYRGDSVMAFWGAPVRHPNHAERACACALSFRSVLVQTQERWEKMYGQRVEFRTGIATGPALVGDLGSALKSNYTVMGEGVGMAVRLESVNRRFGTAVVSSQGTVERCAQQFVFRELERVQLHDGKVESVYELLSGQREFKPEQRQSLTRYEEALSLFRLRRFEEAAARFQALAGADAVSAVYVQRCKDFVLNAPPPDWDATVVLGREEDTA